MRGEMKGGEQKKEKGVLVKKAFPNLFPTVFIG